MDTNEEFARAFGEDGSVNIGALSPQLAVMLTAFSSAGQALITGDEVQTHEGQKILIPEGMGYGQVMAILNRLQEDSETVTSFNHKFLYRPDDGGHAAYQVLRRRYGSVLGETMDLGLFFGTRPPESRTISIAYGETMQIPWGLISIPTLEGVEIQMCDRHRDEEYGDIFELHVTAPKKYKSEIETIFQEIETYLKENSIYRGKAVVGSDDPQFLDLSGFDPSKIVFADEVEQLFKAGIMTVLQYTEALRAEGVPLKQANLLFGPHGTGKTSAMQIIAQKAVENGWTAIFVRTGVDDLEDALLTARLYMPAVVFVEDIDVEASSGEDNEIRRLLESFDGITSKGGELVMVMTTNHIGRIHRGLLRPGRFDFTIEIDSLDRGGIERLIKAVVDPQKLADDVDFAAVGEAMNEFSPAFVRGSCDRAVTFAIARLGGRRDYTMTTEDLVNSAVSLRPQLELQQKAGGGEKPPALNAALVEAVKPAFAQVLEGTGVHYGDGEKAYSLVPAASNGHGSA